MAITYLALFMAKFNIVMTAVNSMIFYVLVVLFTLIVAIIFRKLGNTKYPKLNELTIGGNTNKCYRIFLIFFNKRNNNANDKTDDGRDNPAHAHIKKWQSIFIYFNNSADSSCVI